jgi:hypothetical protein
MHETQGLGAVSRHYTIQVNRAPDSGSMDLIEGTRTGHRKNILCPVPSGPMVRRLSREPTVSGGCERQQSQMTRAFDSTRHLSLMLGAQPRLASWSDLASLADIGPKDVNLLIVHIRHLGHTESALPWPPWAPTIAPTTPLSRTIRRPPCLSCCWSLGISCRRLFCQICSPSDCQMLNSIPFIFNKRYCGIIFWC